MWTKRCCQLKYYWNIIEITEISLKLLKYYWSIIESRGKASGCEPRDAGSRVDKYFWILRPSHPCHPLSITVGIFGKLCLKPFLIVLTRAAVNSASGVRTPMNGLFTGALVILCLAFLMPYCAFIPKVTKIPQKLGIYLVRVICKKTSVTFCLKCYKGLVVQCMVGRFGNGALGPFSIPFLTANWIGEGYIIRPSGQGGHQASVSELKEQGIDGQWGHICNFLYTGKIGSKFTPKILWIARKTDCAT